MRHQGRIVHLMGGRPWTEDELSVAVDHSLSMKEAASRIGRTWIAVQSVRQKASNGTLNMGGPTGDYANPWVVGTRGILLARTCLSCGYFLDSSCFRWVPSQKRRSTPRRYYRDSICKWCRSKAAVESGSGKHRSGGKSKQAQVYISDTSRARSPWTDEDFSIASNPSTTILQKAIELKRTYSAVSTACSRMGYRSLDPNSLGDKSDGQWQIKFPDAVLNDSAVR